MRIKEEDGNDVNADVRKTFDKHWVSNLTVAPLFVEVILLFVVRGCYKEGAIEKK
ncbi:MAG: hypothetical protein ABIH71_03045 [Candidatus Omnitrophota bacterium]|nr:hypothetical protein [Candidatus Omnitrophota bacterium]